MRKLYRCEAGKVRDGLKPAFGVSCFKVAYRAKVRAATQKRKPISSMRHNIKMAAVYHLQVLRRSR